MPAVKQAYERYKDRGFEVVGFNTDEKREDMQGYLDKNGFDAWPEWALGGTGNGQPERFWVSGYPTNILVGRDGRILAREIRLHGKPDPMIEEALAKEVLP